MGLASAIANAVYDATGIRLRELPIRIEKLLTAQHLPSCGTYRAAGSCALRSYICQI